MEKKKKSGGGPTPQVSLEMDLYLRSRIQAQERKDKQKLDRYRSVQNTAHQGCIEDRRDLVERTGQRVR
jgi:hypothetical protein